MCNPSLPTGPLPGFKQTPKKRVASPAHTCDLRLNYQRKKKHKQPKTLVSHTERKEREFQEREGKPKNEGLRMVADASGFASISLCLVRLHRHLGSTTRRFLQYHQLALFLSKFYFILFLFLVFRLEITFQCFYVLFDF